MKLGILAGMGRDWRDSVAKVQVAESLGYDFVATGEAWGPSTLPWLTILATNTKTIRIGTSILNVYSRTPAAIAQEFASLEMLSGGRMVCGLGSSGHRVIEHFHGVPFDTPLRRLREYTEIIKLLLRGESLDYQGRVFSMSRGFRLEYAQQRDDVPVYIAAITPKSIAQTGAIADGIFPIHWPTSQFSSLAADLEQGANSAGREQASIEIAPFTNIYEGDIDSDQALLQNARQPLFHYINRMGDFYWNMLASNGYEEEVSNSRTAWKDRDRDGAFDAISTKMVREIQVVGNPDEVAMQLRARSEAGAHVQMVPMPVGDVATVEAKLQSYLSA